MKLLSLIFSTLFFATAFQSQAGNQAFEPDKIYAGHSGQPTDLSDIAKNIAPGSVVVLGEIHNNPAHHAHQVEFLKALAQEHPEFAIHLGMEFFYWPEQKHVDNYLDSRISEEEFLNTISWGSMPFDFYREQVLFPLQANGKTWAINAPRFLSAKIAKGGLASLTDAEKALLPPDFEIGNDLYFERFAEVMGGHHGISPQKLRNFFEAQSLWDDTMAWKSIEAQASKKDRVFVILVGDFHAAYGGGLPDRLKARGMKDVLSFSQVDVNGLSDDEMKQALLPDPKYGDRASYVWTSLVK